MSNTSTLNKVDIDEEIQSSKWKVLNFLNNGRCVTSTKNFGSEDECIEGIASLAKIIDEVMRGEGGGPNSWITVPNSGEKKFRACEWHHSIPVPVQP